MACCGIEAVVTMDERGQVVIPKELRKNYDLKPGEKLAIISCHDKNGSPCCFTLIKASQMQDVVQSVLGPMMKDVLDKS